MFLALALLWIARIGVFLIPLCVAVQAGEWPLSAEMFFPAVTGRAFVFRAIVEVMLVAWLPLAVADRRFRPRFSWPLVAVSALLGTATLATVFSVYPYRSFWSNCERMGGLIQLLHLAAFFVVAGSVLNSAKLWRWFAISLLVPCAWVCTFLIKQWIEIKQAGDAVYAPENAGRYFHQPGALPNGYFRLDDVFWSPVHAGGFLAVHLFLVSCVLLGAWVALVERLRRNQPALQTSKTGTVALPSWRLLADNYVLMACAALLLFLIPWLLWATGTTSAWHGSALGGLAALFTFGFRTIDRRWRTRAWIGAAIVAAALTAVPLIAKFRPGFIWEIPGFTRLIAFFYQFDSRLNLWSIAWQGFLEHPILGWGPETFGYTFEAYYEPWFYGAEKWWDHPHNSFLSWLCGAGLLGGLAFLGAMAAIVVGLWSSRLTDLTLGQRSLLTGLITAWFVFQTFQPENQSTNIVIFALLAFLHARGRPTAAVQEPSFRIGVAAITLVAAGVGGGFALQNLTMHANAAARVTEALKVKDSRGGIDDNLRHRAKLVAQQSQSPTPEYKEIMRRGDEQLGELCNRAVAAIKAAVSPRTLAQTEAREQLLLLALSLRAIPRFRQPITEFVLAELAADAIDDGQRLRGHYITGVFNLELGRFDEALAALERARALSPRRQLVLSAIGNAYLAKGNKDEAMRTFRQVWELYRDSSAGQAELLVAAIRTRDRAIEDEVLEYIRTTRPSVDPLPEVWQAYYSAGRPDRVIELALPLVERVRQEFASGRGGLLPPMRQQYQRLVTAYERTGQIDQAAALIRELMGFDPTFRERGQKRLDDLEKGRRG